MSTSTLSERIAEEIRVQLARRNISAAELARRTGLKQPYLSRRMTCEVEFDTADLERIAAALDVPVSDLIPGGSRGELNRRSPLAPNHPMPAPGYATPTLTNPPPMTRLNGYTERRSADPATRRPVRLTTPTADSAP